MAGTSVEALVSSYESALGAILRTVTGDPAALRAAAGRCGQWSRRLTDYQQAVEAQAQRLSADWEGDAYQAYAGAARQHAAQAQAAGSTLSYEQGRLEGQAGALETATGTQNQINDWFGSNGRMYVSLAQASGADQAAIAARVHEIGERALQMSEQNKSQLGRLLAGPESEGLTLFDRSRTYTWGTSGSANGMMYGLDGEARVGPHVTGNLELGRTAGNYGLTGKFDASLLDAQGTGFLTDGQTDLRTDAKLKVGADGKLVIGGKDGFAADLNAGAKASIAVSRTDHLGALDVTSKTEASADAGLHANLGKDEQTGEYGAHASLGATAGVTQTESASIGGVKLSVSGGVTTGAGGEGGISGGYDNGHLKFSLDAGATLGEGLKGGVAVDIDVPKVAGEISDGATYVWHGAQQAAAGVGDAVGGAWRSMFGD